MTQALLQQPKPMNPAALQQRDRLSGADTQELFWQRSAADRQQMEAKLAGVQNAAPQAVNKDSYATQLNQTVQFGANLTAGEQASADKRNADRQATLANTRQQAQAQAVQDLQKQVADFQAKQRDVWDQQWAEMQAQIDAYGNSIQQPRLKLNTVQYDTWNSENNGTGGGVPIGQYSNAKYQQIATWARQAGWAEQDIPMVISIAMAESGGNPGAINSSNRNGSIDRGLIQINSVHADLLAQGNVFNPVDNLKMALQVYNGYDGGPKGWSAWSTYQSGAYQKFLSTAKPAGYVQPANMQPFNATTKTGSLRSAIVSTAERYIGLPYVWGGKDLTTGVDCSGLVQEVYKKFGISIPGRADDQAHTALGTRVNDVSKLQPGDLVAWQGGYRGPNYVGHIAIYAGNNQIVEAQQTGVPVHVRSLKAKDMGRVFGVHLNFQ